MVLVTPSPLRTISLARKVQPSLRASANSASSTGPASPLASRATVSLVEVSESMEMRLKLRLTAFRSKGSRRSAGSSASVTK